MTLCSLWNSFVFAGDRFIADPSPKNEGIVISAYAEWVRRFCPHDADEMIEMLCRRVADLIEQRAS